MSPEAALILDLRDLKCPMPVLRTRKALTTLGAGAVLIVECTDPLATIDIPHLLRQTGDLLLSVDRADRVQTFTIRKT